MSDDYNEFMRQLNVERAARLKLDYREKPHGIKKAWLQWEDDSRNLVSREVPLGLDLAAQLDFVDAWQGGYSAGKDDGRFELQRELLDLLGAQRRD